MWSKFLISIAFISSLFLIIFFAEHLTQLRFISRETAPNEQDDGVSSEQTSFDVKGDAKLLFVGDMFFDRYIRKMARIYGEDYLFTCADKVFDSEDMVIGNLEGPITNEPSISEGSEIGSPENYRFTFPTTTAELLRRHSISSVDLGNNHIANYGTDGLRETKHYLTLAQVGYFGGIIGDEAVLESEVNGLPIAFVSYNAFLGTSTDAVAQVIRAEKEQGRIVIVSAHWGDEYSTATEKLWPIAKLFVQSGASLIVGAHPHIILPSETILGVPVYYSLGNFIFDQYWNYSVTHGLVLEVAIHNGQLSLNELRTELEKDGRTCVIPLSLIDKKPIDSR